MSLSDSGLKISQVCAMSDVDVNAFLQKELEAHKSGSLNYEYTISQLLKFGLAYNEQKFIELLDSCIVSHGLKSVYINIIYPVLMRLGLMWRKDNICPAQEHFLSNLVKQRIHTSINSISVATDEAPTWLLFLPEDEDHEIGLLFAQYLLKLAGQKVIYLGAKVPITSVDNVVSNMKIDNILLFMVRNRPSAVALEYLTQLVCKFPAQQLYVAGGSATIIKDSFPAEIRCLTTIDDLENIANPTLHVN